MPDDIEMDFINSVLKRYEGEKMDKPNMSMRQLQGLFDKYEDEFLHFEQVENKLSLYRDIHLMLMLATFQPNARHGTIVASATHDQVWLSPEPEVVARLGTEEQVRDMIRAGLCYDAENDSFFIFA